MGKLGHRDQNGTVLGVFRQVRVQGDRGQTRQLPEGVEPVGDGLQDGGVDAACGIGNADGGHDVEDVRGVRNGHLVGIVLQQLGDFRLGQLGDGGGSAAAVGCGSPRRRCLQRERGQGGQNEKENQQQAERSFFHRFESS